MEGNLSPTRGKFGPPGTLISPLGQRERNVSAETASVTRPFGARKRKPHFIISEGLSQDVICHHLSTWILEVRRNVVSPRRNLTCDLKVMFLWLRASLCIGLRTFPKSDAKYQLTVCATRTLQQLRCSRPSCLSTRFLQSVHANTVMLGRGQHNINGILYIEDQPGRVCGFPLPSKKTIPVAKKCAARGAKWGAGGI